MGRGFDCKKSTIKGYINVKGKVIDVERLLAGDGYDYVKQEPIKLYPYSTVEIFLLYNGGGWVISENRDLNKYIDNIYLNSQVETKIGDDVLRLFTEDIGNIEENLQGNYFHKAECFHPTSRYTLPHVWPHYLCFFLSKEFLNDLEKSNGDEIVKNMVPMFLPMYSWGDIPLFLMLLNIAICYLMWILGSGFKLTPTILMHLVILWM